MVIPDDPAPGDAGERLRRLGRPPPGPDPRSAGCLVEIRAAARAFASAIISAIWFCTVPSPCSPSSAPRGSLGRPCSRPAAFASSACRVTSVFWPELDIPRAARLARDWARLFVIAARFWAMVENLFVFAASIVGSSMYFELSPSFAASPP